MQIILFLFSFLVLIFTIFSFFRLLPILKKKKLPFRGTLKFYILQLEDFDKDESKVIVFWSICFAVSMALPWFFLMFFYNNNNYSFFIALYPFFWIYFMNRVLFFEASDFLEETKPSKKK